MSSAKRVSPGIYRCSIPLQTMLCPSIFYPPFINFPLFVYQLFITFSLLYLLLSLSLTSFLFNFFLNFYKRSTLPYFFHSNFFTCLCLYITIPYLDFLNSISQLLLFFQHTRERLLRQALEKGHFSLELQGHCRVAGFSWSSCMPPGWRDDLSVFSTKKAL